MLKLPNFGAGQRIGLFGGSFNPPHAGHRHVALTAIRALKLDWLWVLITPGNPLKNAPGLSMRARMHKLAPLMRHPKIILSDLEDKAQLRFSLDTVRFLKKRAPLAHFVWVMGADNLSSFHLWQGWDEIAKLLPIAVIDREEGRFAGLNAKAALSLSGFRLKAKEAASLPLLLPPAWVFLHGKHIRLSSSALRKPDKH